MCSLRRRQVILLAILVLSTFLPYVYADRGGFSPKKERVSESGQKAIVAWNGSDEILILSTDVSSSQESEVIELMPLPTNPTISKGEKQSFTVVKDLVNSYFDATSAGGAIAESRFLMQGWRAKETPQITITFQETIGAHFLTVVRVEKAEDLIQWLEDFLEHETYGKELPPNLSELLSSYVQNGMNYFVIDVIETEPSVKTVDTLVYEFRSSKLYYPMQISSLFSGNTEISLFTITNNELDDTSFHRIGFTKKAQFQVRQEALDGIHANLTRLLSANPHLCYFRFTGPLESLNCDIMADSRLAPDIPTAAAASLTLCLGFVVLFLSLPGDRLGFPKRLNISATKRLEVASVLVGLLGLCLTLIGFFLPLGLVEIGKHGVMLITVIAHVYVTPFELGDPLFLFFLMTTIFSYVYLLIKRNSKIVSTILMIGGAYMIVQALTSSIHLYALGNGMYSILLGCSSIISAGLLSSWHMDLKSVGVTMATQSTTFNGYIVKKRLTSIMFLAGVLLFFFLMWFWFRVILNYI